MQALLGSPLLPLLLLAVMWSPSSACEDSDHGATDKDGDACSVYKPQYCGAYDDHDFHSNDMCCICGGGREACHDTDNGARDKDGDACAIYEAGYCGSYDDGDFHSNEMCCICGGGSSGSSSSSSTGSSWTQAVLDHHNKLRRQVRAQDMTQMVWNTDLAERAQGRADMCAYKNAPRDIRMRFLGKPVGNIGENLAMDSGGRRAGDQATSADLTHFVDQWYNQIEDAGPYKNGGVYRGLHPAGATPGKAIGSYTQVVWADADQLGCGVATCHDTAAFPDPGFYLVCWYGSTIGLGLGGNVKGGGAKLFTKGSPCREIGAGFSAGGACPSGFDKCVDGLCAPTARLLEVESKVASKNLIQARVPATGAFRAWPLLGVVSVAAVLASVLAVAFAWRRAGCSHMARDLEGSSNEGQLLEVD